MTYTELMEYAKKHYCQGGDSVYECWDENTFNEYVELFGEMTQKKADAMFEMYADVDRDRAGWR